MLIPHDSPSQSLRSIKDYRKNGVSQTGSSSTIGVFGRDVLETVNNPNYQIQIAKRVDAGSPYLRGYTDKFAPLIATGSCKVGTNQYTGYLHLMPSLFSPTDYTLNLPGPDLQVVRDQALMHLKNKLSSKTGSYKAATTIAEAKDMYSTFEGMVNTTTSFILGCATAKKRIYKNPKKALANFIDFVSDAWLTYSFGIAPTVSDFENLAESAMWRLARIHSIRETGGMRLTFQDVKQQGVYLCGNFPSGDTQVVSVDVRGAYQNTVSVLFSAGRYIDLDNPMDGTSLHDQFGLNWSSIVPASYEIIPFSWLLDYFTTTGNVLNDFSYSPAGTTVYNYETRIQEFNLNASANIIRGSATYSNNASAKAPVHSGKFIRRIRLSNLPHQSLRVKTFEEIGTNALNRISNLASIGSGVFSRSLRK